MSENDGVSVVICCFNSSKRIPATLEHLQKIKTSGIPWEVVLVDNNSEDDTTEKALSIWNINPVTRLKIVSEKNRGLINARITGVKSASYDIISFIDDDNWIESQWIDKVYDLLNNDQSMAACGGSSEAVFEINPPAWFTDFSFYYAVGKQQEESGYVSLQKGYLWGAGLTIKKKAWNYLFENGFNNLLKGRTGKSLTAGEDSEICFALILSGWKLWYEDSLKLQHYIPAVRLNVPYLMKIYEGFGKAAVVLSLYISFINGQSLKNSNWAYQTLASIKRMCKTGIKNLFPFEKNKIKNHVLWKHDKAYALELLFSRKKYSDTKQQIVKIYQASGSKKIS